MKKRKLALWLLMVVTACLFVFCGCGKKANPTAAYTVYSSYINEHDGSMSFSDFKDSHFP